MEKRLKIVTVLQRERPLSDTLRREMEASDHANRDIKIEYLRIPGIFLPRNQLTGQAGNGIFPGISRLSDPPVSGFPIVFRTQRVCDINYLFQLF